jgi:hypothetical protein
MAENPQAAANRVPLRGSMKHVRPSFEAVGPADPNEVVRIAIKIRPKNPLLDPAIQGAMLPTQRPAPQTYAHHVANYGADPADIDKVVQFARAHNLTVVEADAGQRMVVVTGPPARPDRRGLHTLGITHWPTLRQLTPTVTGVLAAPQRPWMDS